MDYTVAFRGRKTSGGYEGVITSSTWESKEEFQKWAKTRAGMNRLEIDEVLEEGITEDRALQLGRSTPIKSRIAVAIQEALTFVDPKTMKISKEAMDYVAEKAASAVERSLRSF